MLVNNAGIIKDNLLLMMKDEEWDDVIAVNLTGAARMARAALRPILLADEPEAIEFIRTELRRGPQVGRGGGGRRGGGGGVGRGGGDRRDKRGPLLPTI